MFSRVVFVSCMTVSLSTLIPRENILVNPPVIFVSKASLAVLNRFPASSAFSKKDLGFANVFSGVLGRFS